MKKIVANLATLGRKALVIPRKLWAKEPARVVSTTAAVIVFVCAKLGVVVPVESVSSALAFALPFVLGGEIIRSQVSPTASLPKPLTVADLTPAPIPPKA